MFRKSFVSLYFSPEKLQVVQLNSNKKAVKKLASLDLPKEVVSNYLVQDKKALSELIKKVWKSMGITEKSVGLVIPEFSTFAKNLVFPKLDFKELDEAIRWQMQDFLPSSGEMILDWKVVKADKEGYQVLIIAVPKDILAGFVDAVGLAGLYPLVVETPSLSLVRISDHTKSGKLIIYGGFGEVTMVIALGEKILGSSVLNTGDGVDISKTAVQIVGHYSSVAVERVMIGGIGFNQNVLKNLQESLGKKVDWINADIKGVTAEQFQECLVPISMQFKDPAEPRDETTINLLPPDWVKKYKNKKIKAQTWSLALTSTVIILGCFWASFGTHFLMNQNLEFLKGSSLRQIESIKTESEKVLDQTQDINRLASKVEKIVASSGSPIKVIDAINNARSAGITISSYSMDLNKGKILLKGRALTRQDLVAFKNSLEKSGHFSKVTLPVTSFESEVNLEFSLDIQYGEVGEQKPIKIKLQ